MRAARRFAVLTGESRGAALRLEKRLPTAAGIGGGSRRRGCDIAGARGAMGTCGRRHNHGARGRLGADVPACLAGRPVWVGGIGERIEAAPGLPELGIVLANPRIALPTPAVFRVRTRPFGRPARFDPVPRNTPGTLVELLAARRNDSTEAALASVPEIACGARPPRRIARCADRTDERQRRDLLCIVRRPRRRGRRGRGSQRGGTRLLVGRRRPAARTAAGRGYQLLGARVVGAVAGTETGIAVTRECGAGSGGASRIAASTWEAMFSARFLSPS